MAAHEQQTLERLAVIESRLDDIRADLKQISAVLPGSLVEHTERIAVLERTQRTLAWGIGLFSGGMLSAFLAHLFG